MSDKTRKFDTVSNRMQIREILSSVYDSLVLKGYNPVNQLVGYILSEDPTYITNYNNARSLICRIDRDELLEELASVRGRRVVMRRTNGPSRMKHRKVKLC